MYKPFLHILFYLLPCALRAQQNLVPNPSFEDFTQCPENREDIENLIAWYSPTTGTPDVHHSCINNQSTEEVPQNGFGWQWPRTGDAYMGIIISLNSGNEYREYIQCELTQPLQGGELYKVEFFISRSDSSTKACNNIGVFLSTDPISASSNISLPYSPQVLSTVNEPITDPIEWTQITNTVVASGDEMYLTIGVFSNNFNTNWIEVEGGWEDEAHYYVDDVSVVPIDNLIMPTIFSPNGDGTNDEFSISFLDFSEGEMKVYDRWGRLVFSAVGAVLEWDGRTKSGNATEGIYYVVAILRNTIGIEIIKKGFVHLLR